MLEKAMWAHGHSIAIERPSDIKSEWRAGFFTRIVGAPGRVTWFHFAVPTPVIVNDNRLRIDSALVRVQTPGVRLTNLHVYDGENRIATHDGLTLSPHAWEMLRFNVANKPDVAWGIGISIGVTFIGATDAANTIDFAAAGCDFLP